MVTRKGIIYQTEEQRQLYEGISERTGFSVKEIVEMVREYVSAALDPIEAEGELFEFEPDPNAPIGDLDWIDTEVPKPDAQVDLITALYKSKSDLRRCKQVLAKRVPLGKLLAVMRNMIGWLRFRAVRDPSPEGREEAKRQLAEWERQIAELKVEAWKSGNKAVIRGLDRALGE
jgi:hypothetical protein